MSALEEDPGFGVSDASGDGRNFAVSGGVAKSVENVIQKKYSYREIKMANAEGLKECRKLLTMAKAGKYNGYLRRHGLSGRMRAEPARCSQSKSRRRQSTNMRRRQHKISSQTEYKRTGQAGRLKKNSKVEKKSEKKRKMGFCGSDSCNGTSVCRMRPDRDRDKTDQKVQYQKVIQTGIGNRR